MCSAQGRLLGCTVDALCSRVGAGTAWFQGGRVSKSTAGGGGRSGEQGRGAGVPLLPELNKVIP